MAGSDVGKVVVDGPVIGIDIGNTSSRVAVWHNNKVEVIPNDVNERVTPSCVKFVDNGVLVGRAETILLNSIPENTISDLKRMIGRRYDDKVLQKDMKHWPFRVVEGRGEEARICVYHQGEEMTFSTQEISALLIRNMKDSAEAFLEKEVSNAVITVPACFNDSQRRATKDACQIAGLNVVRIINDTTAAALAYAQHEKDLKKKNLLVFDLGGGSLDVSIVEIEGCHFEVKAVAGDAHLGGKDVDDRMVEHMVSQLKTQSDIDIATGNPKALAKLRREWEKAKRSISNAKNVRIDTDFLSKEKEIKLVVSRTEFEDLNREFFLKCLEQVKLCFNDATMRTEDIDQVVLVGGSSRISKVRRLLKDYFEGKEPYYGLDPETAVACGAAILGSNIIVTENQDELMIITRDLIIEEILPFSLGVRGKEGIMDVIARKGTTIPFNSNKIHTTHSDNLTDITYHIHIGEETVAIDNQFLGDFQIAGIKPAPAGVPRLLVTYSVDLNGMLNIVAEELRGEAVHNITIIETSQGMVNDETEKQSRRGPVLGIDFGTSNICMAVWENDQVLVINDDQGDRVMPSYVSFTEDDEILFGEAAKSNMVSEPRNTIFGIKRLISRQYDDKFIEEDRKSWPFEVVEGDGGKATIAVHVHDNQEKKLYTPEQVLSHILGYLKEMAEQRLNHKPIEDVVMTVPVYFGQLQRRAIAKAASKVGLNVVRFVNEPTAAAVAYAFGKESNRDEEKKVLVFDLGGGTLDISVLGMKKSTVEVITTGGDAHLGGEDIDRNIFNYLSQKFTEKECFNINESAKSIVKLKKASEEAKKNICGKTYYKPHCRVEIESLYKGIDFHEGIDKSMFEDLNKDLFMRCIEPVSKCLEQAKLEVNQIDEVVLVGGSSRIPTIREELQKLFNGKELLCSLDPMEVVASGAAILGATLDPAGRDNFILEFNFKDATPASLGFERKDGTMTIVVQRDASIPTKKVVTFPRSQLPTTLSVYEGENKIATENNLLGVLEFPDAAPSSGPRSLEISFDVNTSSVQVTVSDKESRKTIAKTFSDVTRRLEKDAIAEMVRANETASVKEKNARRRQEALVPLKDYVMLITERLRNEKVVKPRLGAPVYNLLHLAITNVNEWLNDEATQAGIDDINHMMEAQNLIFNGFKSKIGI